MASAYITRTENFCAAHRLYNPNWDDKKNIEVFGKCANPNFHGHNYYLSVTIKGVPNTDTGFIFNAKELGDLIKEVIIEKVDHKNLNLDVDFLKDKFTSVENLCIHFWEQLAPWLKKMGATLYKIEIKETNKIVAFYLGE